MFAIMAQRRCRAGWTEAQMGPTPVSWRPAPAEPLGFPAAINTELTLNDQLDHPVRQITQTYLQKPLGLGFFVFVFSDWRDKGLGCLGFWLFCFCFLVYFGLYKELCVCELECVCMCVTVLFSRCGCLVTASQSMPKRALQDYFWRNFILLDLTLHSV